VREELTVHLVFVGEQDGILMAVFGEDDEGAGFRLEFQRALEFDQQDRALGMDTYSISTSGGATCYGGLNSWRLEDTRLDLDFTEAATNQLGIPRQARFWLPDEGEQILAVRKQLGLICWV